MSEEQACSNFQIDLVGAFGICKNCKLPKLQHNSSSQPNKPFTSNLGDKKQSIDKKDVGFQNLKPQKEEINFQKPSLPEKANKKEENKAPALCKNFQIDLTGEAGRCKNCKQLKINHENAGNLSTTTCNSAYI